MRRAWLIDTGPIVALLDRRDRHHAWAKARVSPLKPPLLTCESVLSEACFLVQHLPGGPQTVLRMVQQGLLKVRLSLQEEIDAIQRLVTRYAEVPMSLADAGMVRLSELEENCALLTCDSDFKIYRRNGRSPIPLVVPEEL